MKSFSYGGKQLFDKPDGSKLKNEKTLNEVGKYLEQTQYGLVVVTASEDGKGDSDKDQVLTQARALVVREYLVKNFKVDDTRMKTLGSGKTDITTEDGKVEILVSPEINALRTPAPAAATH